MSWLNVLNPLGWVLLLAVPPLIVLLYFLKLRRRPIEVPSTYLWKKAIEDMHVNSLWQRLRNNLLMFLQILTVLLLALACLRPGCQGVQLAGNRFVFMIDTSASMSTTDLENGSRLEEAKRQVKVMIDRMKPGDAAMVIGFSNRAEVTQSYTTNQTLLKRKVDSLEQTQRGSDLREALIAAAGLANPGRTATQSGDTQIADAKPATLMIFTDGGFADVNDFNLGNLTPEYHAIGGLEIPDNIGITAFSINDDPNVSEQREVFGQIRNSSTVEKTTSVTLLVDGKIFDAQKNIVIPAGRAAGISFPLTSLFQNLESSTKLELMVEPEDALKQDNLAYAVVNPPRLANVLIVSPGNDYLRLATDTEPIKKVANIEFQSRDFLETADYQRKSLEGEYDLIIYDQCQPTVMPQCNTLFFGTKPPGDGWKFGEVKSPSPVVDYFRTHPMMNTLQLTSLTILESAAIEGPPGTQSLLDSLHGSIIALAPRGGLQDLVVSFPLSKFSDNVTEINTDWPSKLSFPLFIQNVISTLAGGSRYLTVENIGPGELARLRPPQSVTKITVTTPNQKQYQIARDKSSGFLFSQTDETGVYTLKPSEYSSIDPPANQIFAVNLFDPQESNLAVRDKLEIGFEAVEAKTEVLPARSEFWKYAVAVALMVLLLEWFIYNRRVLI